MHQSYINAVELARKRAAFTEGGGGSRAELCSAQAPCGRGCRRQPRAAPDLLSSLQPLNKFAHLLRLGRAAMHMHVVCFGVKAAVLSFEHGRDRRGQIPAYSGGKSLLYRVYVRSDEYAYDADWPSASCSFSVVTYIKFSPSVGVTFFDERHLIDEDIPCIRLRQYVL